MVNRIEYSKAEEAETNETNEPIPQNEEPTPRPDVQAEGEDSRPSWLPEKFATPEDMAKSYAEMERKQGEEPDDAERADSDTTDSIPDDVSDKLTPEVLDSYATKWSEQGQEFNDEQYKELEELGLSRIMVDRYVEGQKAVMQSQATELFSDIGGVEAYKEMAEWASENWSTEKIASFDQALSQNMESAKLAVQGLQANYQEANGRQPSLLKGVQPSSGSGAFQSSAEITKAMSNPLYKTDHAYRDEVHRKLQNSNF